MGSSTGLLVSLIGLILFFMALTAVRTGVVKTRLWSWAWNCESWYRDKNPLMFKIVVTIYFVLGIVLTVLGILGYCGIVDLNKQYFAPK